MNYSALKQQHPRVFLLFEKWVEEHYETTLNIWNGTIRMEDVIEFLDSRRVFINIDGANNSWGFYVIIFSNIGHSNIKSENIYKSRKASTEAAITKAFEIYESRNN